MAALAEANIDHAPSYGTDELTLKSKQMFSEIFGAGTEAYFVFNGTAANVLALSSVVKPYQSILTSAMSHLVNDECGAAERAIGCRVIAIANTTGKPELDAKLTPKLIKPWLIRRGDQHASQPRAISITQPTELGTLYSRDEIRALADFAHREGLILHMDGARLVNAAAALGCELKDLTSAPGVDILSLGGTKNGLMFGEAVVFFKQAASGLSLDHDFKFIRKQLMQLPSKTRFIAAQFNVFLGTDFWRENAQHANRMAALLSQGLSRSKYCKVARKTEANGVFVRVPQKMVAPLKAHAFFYVWDEHSFECRLMTTWDTTASEVTSFLAAVERIGREVIDRLLPEAPISVQMQP